MTKFRTNGHAVEAGDQLSGNAYVNVCLKETPDSPGRVRVRSHKYCEHDDTVCVECVDSWLIDYRIDFDRTCAGRSLYEAMRKFS